MKALATLMLLSLISVYGHSASAPPSAAVQQLQQRWAEIKYQTAKEQQPARLAQLSDEARQAVEQFADVPEVLIWQAIILSTYAGEKGGLGALKLVKQAREALQRALKLDAAALAGSAYTSLGALYYQVPGWPISFGNDNKARQLLEQGLSINPDGIDSNFFYADFLLDQKEIEKARQVLQHALQAPDRPGRPLADAGRRQEIRELLAKLEQ